MTNPTVSKARRVFMLSVASAAAVAPLAVQAQKKVEESDDNAIALGYKHDTSKVDGAKYAQHKKEQQCNNCSFWQGSKTDEWAGCAMFGRKQIAAKGWCVAYKPA